MRLFSSVSLNGFLDTEVEEMAIRMEVKQRRLIMSTWPMTSRLSKTLKKIREVSCHSSAIKNMRGKKLQMNHIFSIKVFSSFCHLQWQFNRELHKVYILRNTSCTYFLVMKCQTGNPDNSKPQTHIIYLGFISGIWTSLT